MGSAFHVLVLAGTKRPAESQKADDAHGDGHRDQNCQSVHVLVILSFADPAGRSAEYGRQASASSEVTIGIVQRCLSERKDVTLRT
jgi:hypothetical protein